MQWAENLGVRLDTTLILLVTIRSVLPCLLLVALFWHISGQLSRCELQWFVAKDAGSYYESLVSSPV